MKDNLNNLLKDSEAFDIVFNSVPLHIVITDEDGKIILANKVVEEITGFTKEEIIGKTPRLWGGQMEKSFYQDFWHEIKDKKNVFKGIIKNKKKNGQEYYAAIKVTPILDEDKKVIGFCGIEQDITEIQTLSDEHDLTKVQRDIIKRMNRVS